MCDIEAGKYLHKVAKRPAAPYWAEGCHHENVEMSAGQGLHAAKPLRMNALQYAAADVGALFAGYVPALRRTLQCWGLWD